MMSALLNLRRFRRESDGVMAVEFSLILPVMLFMLFGMVELTDAIQAKRRVNMAASMLGDLTTNRSENWLFEDELEGIFQISGRVLEPYGIDGVQVQVTAVSYDDATMQPVVVWSRIRGPNGEVLANPDADYAPGMPFQGLTDQTYQLAGEGLVDEGRQIVSVELQYNFESALAGVIYENGFVISTQELRTPRRAPVLRYCEVSGCSDGVAWNNAEAKPQDEI